MVTVFGYVFGFYLLVINTSASDCLERLIPEMTYYVSRGTLNSTHSRNQKGKGPHGPIFIEENHINEKMFRWLRSTD